MSEPIQNENAVQARKEVKSTVTLEYKDLLDKSVKIGDDSMQHVSGEIPLENYKDAFWTLKTTFPTSGDSREVSFEFEVMNFPKKLQDDSAVEFIVCSSSEGWEKTSKKLLFQSTFKAVQTCKISDDTVFTVSLVVGKKEDNGMLKSLLNKTPEKKFKSEKDKKLDVVTEGYGPAVVNEPSECKRDGGKHDVHGKRSEDKADHEGLAENKADGGESAAAGDGLAEPNAVDKPAADVKADGEPEAKKSRTEQ